MWNMLKTSEKRMHGGQTLMCAGLFSIAIKLSQSPTCTNPNVRPNVNVVETSTLDGRGSTPLADDSSGSSEKRKRASFKQTVANAKGTASGWLSALGSMLQPAGSHLAVSNNAQNCDDVSAAEMSIYSTGSGPTAEQNKLLSSWRKFSSKNDSGQRAGRTRHVSSSSSEAPGIRPVEWRDDTEEVSYAPLLVPYARCTSINSMQPSDSGGKALDAQSQLQLQNSTSVKRRDAAPPLRPHRPQSRTSECSDTFAVAGYTQSQSQPQAPPTPAADSCVPLVGHAQSCVECAAIREHLEPQGDSALQLHVCVHEGGGEAEKDEGVDASPTTPVNQPDPSQVARLDSGGGDSPDTLRARRGTSVTLQRRQRSGGELHVTHSSPAVSNASVAASPGVHKPIFPFPAAAPAELQDDPLPFQMQMPTQIPFVPYDASVLNKPGELGLGHHKTALRFTGYVISIIEHVEKDQLKKEMNEQFRLRFPYIQLTYSKFKSIKRDMCAIANDVGLDDVTLAHGYVYFEKCVLKGCVNKTNRKLVAGACVLLSAKMCDIRGAQLTSLISSIESTMRESRKELLAHELPVAIALEFNLRLPDGELRPHWVMLRQGML